MIFISYVVFFNRSIFLEKRWLVVVELVSAHSTTSKKPKEREHIRTNLSTVFALFTIQRKLCSFFHFSFLHHISVNFQIANPTALLNSQSENSVACISITETRANQEGKDPRSPLLASSTSHSLLRRPITERAISLQDHAISFFFFVLLLFLFLYPKFKKKLFYGNYFSCDFK